MTDTQELMKRIADAKEHALLYGGLNTAFWPYQRFAMTFGELFDALEAAQAEIEWLTQDRNEWKDSTVAANENQRRAEKKASDMQDQRDAALARLAEMTTQEPVCFVPTYALEQMEEGMEPPHQLYKKQNSHATLPLFASAGASPEPSALQAENANLITALAVCRGAFPVPYADSRLYDWYVGAMADPLAVPDYVKACVGASPVQPVQCLQSVADALTIEQLNDKVERLMAVQPSQAKCPTCGSDCNERDELIKAEREIERLKVQPSQVLGFSSDELNALWNFAVETGDPTAGNTHLRFARAIIAAINAKGSK